MRFLCALIVILSRAFTTAAAAATANGEQVYIKSVYSLPLTFDPIKMNDTSSLQFSELAYEGLLRLGPDYNFLPGIASSWSVDDSGKKLTFELNPKAKFQNGNQVTAADVVASLSRAVGPRSRVYSLFQLIDGAEEFYSRKAKTVSGLIDVNAHTVEIILKKPFPPMMYILAGATAKILPASDLKRPDFFQHPIGSGPFQFDHRDSRSVTLKKASTEAATDVQIDKFILFASGEKEAKRLAIRGKVDDLGSWPLTGTESVFSKTNGQHFDAVVANTWIIGLNSRLLPFRDKAVRQAFRASFDSEAFRKKFYPVAEPAFGLIPPAFLGYQASPKNDFILPAHFKPPTGRIRISIPKELSKSAKIARFIEDRYKKSGWNVEVRMLEWSKLMDGYDKKTLQAFLVAMNIDYPDPDFLLRNFESKNPDNFSGMSDPALDEKLGESRGNIDRVTREQMIRKIIAQIDEFAPAIYLFHPRVHYWTSACVRGFSPNMLSDVYIDYRRVSFDSECLHKMNAETK